MGASSPALSCRIWSLSVFKGGLIGLISSISLVGLIGSQYQSDSATHLL